MDGVESKRNFSECVGHLELNKLVLSQRFAKLLALHGVFSRLVEAELSSAHRSPCNTESSLVKAAEGSLESLDVQHVLLGHSNVVHKDHTSG